MIKLLDLRWILRLPPGLLGAMLLILGVERFIDTHKVDTMGDSLWCYETTRQLATDKVKDCKVLVLGDSQVSHGVAVSVIKEQTGLEGFNLSMSGAQPATTYFLFREALAAGARPRVVFVDFFPRLFGFDQWFNMVNLPVVASYRDCLEMAVHERDFVLLGSLIIRKALPSVRCRESIREVITQCLAGYGGVSRLSREVLARNREINRGLTILPDRRNACDLDAYYKVNFPPFHCNSLNRLYIDRFLSTAAEYGVSVVLLLPPSMPAMQVRLEAEGYDAKHEAFVRALMASHPEISVLDARRSNYDPDVFIDPSHLSYDGAKTYSIEIGEYLRANLGKSIRPEGRWFAMNPYKKRSFEAHHETFEDSRVALLNRSCR